MTKAFIDINPHLESSILESIRLIRDFETLDRSLSHEEKCALVYVYAHPRIELKYPLLPVQSVLYNNGLINYNAGSGEVTRGFRNYSLTSLGEKYREHLVLTDTLVAYTERCYLQPSFQYANQLSKMTIRELCNILIADASANTGVVVELTNLGFLEPTEQYGKVRASVKGKLLLQTLGFAGQCLPDSHLKPDELRTLEDVFVYGQIEWERVNESIRDTLKAKEFITCVSRGIGRCNVAMATDKAVEYILEGRISFPDSPNPTHIVSIIFTKFYSWIHSWGTDSELISEKIIPNALLWVRSSGLEKRFRDDPNTQVVLPEPTAGMSNVYGAKQWLTDYITDLLKIGRGLSDA